jgi:hypothetical protein
MKRYRSVGRQTFTNAGAKDWGSAETMDEWTGGDLNPRPPECKSGIRSRLNYQPTWF